MTAPIHEHAPTAEHLLARRERYAEAIDPGATLVVIGAGEPIGVPGGADRTYPFLAHPEYYHLAEQEVPGSILAYDRDTGWAHFAPPVTDVERTWERVDPRSGDPLPELAGWLTSRRGRPIANLGCPVPGIHPDPASSLLFAERALHHRRVKDEREVEAIRTAANQSAAAYAKLPKLIQPGATERGVQIELEAEFFRAGASGTQYDSIVAAGSNAAVLHFAPTSRTVESGECVLIDAGAAHGRYTSDISRVYAADGSFTDKQRAFYNTVLHAQEHAVRSCRDGVEFHDLHRQTASDMASGLVDLGLLKGDPADLVERGAMALFFPHGLGHLVGLGIRDASGRLPGREQRRGPGGTNIRLDVPLRSGYVVTIEPGLYFIPGLIDKDETRARFAAMVSWSAVDDMRTHIQGVRIEDDILVTSGAPENLTKAIGK
ncbi:MAG: M24 family metallopeptidase [Planctomycetota bacterium]